MYFVEPESGPSGTGSERTGGPQSGSLPERQRFEPEIQSFTAATPPTLQEARAVCDLFNKVYADNYPCPIFMSPQRYKQAIENGSLHSWMATSADGQVIGHAAIAFHGDSVGELGRLFVDPDARGLGLAGRLTRARMDTVPELVNEGKLTLLHCEAVTSHQNSQRLYRHYRFSPTGFIDRKYPDFFDRGYRESVIRLSTILKPAVKLDDRKIFIPEVLRDIVEDIYWNHNCVRQVFSTAASEVTDRRNSVKRPIVHVDSSELRMYGDVTLTVDPGATPAQLLRAIDQAFDRSATHLTVRIDVQDSGAIDLLNVLRTRKFYFSALEPQDSGDFVVMQRLRPPHSLEAGKYVEGFFDPRADELLAEIVKSQVG